MHMVRMMLAMGALGLVQAGGLVQASGAGEALAQAAGTPQAATPAQGTPALGTPDMPRRRPEEAQSDPMLAFDINKNGKLELAEVKSAAAARYDELNPDLDDKMDEKEAAAVLQGAAFREADPDGDGTINKAEYLAYVERMFERANPDKDGALERAELDTEAGRALMQLMR